MTPRSQGVQTVTVFQTTDGKHFDSQREADAHQLGLNRRKAIHDQVRVLVATTKAQEIEAITCFLYLHIEKVRDLVDRMRTADLLNDKSREMGE